MDPNANLKRQLRLARAIKSGTLNQVDLVDDADDLADYVLWLNDWLTKGGSLPDAWRHAGDRPSARQ